MTINRPSQLLHKEIAMTNTETIINLDADGIPLMPPDLQMKAQAEHTSKGYRAVVVVVGAYGGTHSRVIHPRHYYELEANARSLAANWLEHPSNRQKLWDEAHTTDDVLIERRQQQQKNLSLIHI